MYIYIYIYIGIDILAVIVSDNPTVSPLAMGHGHCVPMISPIFVTMRRLHHSLLWESGWTVWSPVTGIKFRRFWNGFQSQHDVEKLMELMYLYLFQETFDIIWPGIYSFCQGEVENLLFTLFCRRRRYTEPSCRLDFCPDPAVMPGYVWNTSGPRPSGGHMAPSLALNDAVVDGLSVALNSEMEQHLEQLIRNDNII